jgi:hypothetical protein
VKVNVPRALLDIEGEGELDIVVSIVHKNCGGIARGLSSGEAGEEGREQKKGGSK